MKVEDAEDNKYYVIDGTKKGIFKYRIELPPYVTCTQCILQWTYCKYTALLKSCCKYIHIFHTKYKHLSAFEYPDTGNMWGTCPNGTEAIGCGKPGE